MSTSLITALQSTASRFGDDRGIRFYATPDDSEYVGYAEVDRRARAIAHALQQRGFRPGQTAVLALLPGVQWSVAVFGALYAGLAVVPAPMSGYGSSDALLERVSGIAVASDAVLVIGEPAAIARLGDPAPGVLPETTLVGDLLAAGDAEAWTAPGVGGDDIAFLMFTSGSTGEPKGAVGTHGSILAAVDATSEMAGMAADSVVVGWAPLHHAMGLMLQVIAPAAVGAHAVLTGPEQFQRRPLFWLQLISKHRGTISIAGNFAFALCTQFATDRIVAELDLSSLTALLCGSEPVRLETIDAFVTRFASTGLQSTAFCPALGMTETMLISSKPMGTEMISRRFDPAQFDEGRLVDAEGDGGTSMVSCGRWLSDTVVAVVDPETLTRLPEGHIGELWLTSPQLCAGYFRRPDATAETFGFRLPGEDHEFLRTGDLVGVVDGELYVVGRLKEVIIIRGRNVYPQDIEAAAQLVHPAVGVGAAFELDGHPAPVGIVLEYDAEAVGDHELDALAADLQRSLTTSSSLPSIAVAFVSEGTIPRTPTGKVRRRPTRDRLNAGGLEIRGSKGFVATAGTSR